MERKNYEYVEEYQHTSNYCHIPFLIAYVLPQQAPISFQVICFSVLNNFALDTELRGEMR
jgi:hypothetical protein